MLFCWSTSIGSSANFLVSVEPELIDFSWKSDLETDDGFGDVAVTADVVDFASAEAWGCLIGESNDRLDIPAKSWLRADDDVGEVATFELKRLRRFWRIFYYKKYIFCFLLL